MSKEKDPRHAVRSTPSAVSTTVEHRALGDGISGSAMAVPPPKAATYAVRPDKPVKTVKYGLRKSLLVSKSDTSNCNTKQKKEVTDRSQELKDSLAREKQVQGQASSLQQLVDKLQAELNNARTSNEDLQKRLTDLEDWYKTALEKETSARSKLEKDLEDKCTQLKKTVEDKNSTEQQLAELQLLNEKLESEVADLKTQKDTELAARDTKLDKLKTQLANSLTDNSWERQKQLDELRKDLENVQEEADILRSQLRSVQRNAQQNCSNCKKMAAKMASMQSASQASERTIKNLKDVIALHDKQPTDGTLQQR